MLRATFTFDGLVSCLRSYTVQELLTLSAGLDARHYLWEVGSVKSNGSLLPITYLVGVPAGFT